MPDSVRPHGLQPTRLLRPWDFPGKSTGMGCHCLLVTNSTQVPFYFILMGMGIFYTWISIPFCCLYTISIIGNSIILAVIRAEPSLREPMYFFLSMLALRDLGLIITTWPTVMGILWFNASGISFEACFAQFFFLIDSPLWNLHGAVDHVP